MPWKCKTPSQGNPSAESTKAAQAAYDRRRGKDRQWYGKTQWRKVREAFLKENPLCVDCQSAGQYEPANEVHHKIRRKDNESLQFDFDNLEALCHSCHSKRTAEERNGI